MILPSLEARTIAVGGTLIELVIADGVLAALSFSVAGTLLKTIALNSWTDIRTFAFVLVLRTALKRVFQAEQKRMAARSGVSTR